ncbi:MAG: MinD/ParA family protein [Deltaproteobacteria bacterium]|nr:MinD/ParA family protein [Deltaproteobacteria bacterium]
MDQAVTLRNMAEKRTAPGGAHERSTRVIAVSSGKGGVGKTNSVVNLAVAFSKMGKKVLLLDADLGLGNLDVLLGLAPKYNIGHLLRGERTLDEVLVKGPSDILILPASSGVHELTDLDAEERLSLQSYLEDAKMDIDIMIIDTGAGISNNVLYFSMAAQEIVVVVSPEPTSITDAYALMKVLFQKHGERRFRLLVNTVRSKKEALDVYRKKSLAAEKFLGISVDYLGFVLHDENVPKAVVRQKAVMEIFPNTKASLCYREIAETICGLPENDSIKGGMQFFWRQVLGRDF